MKKSKFLIFYLFTFTFGGVDSLRGLLIPILYKYYHTSYTLVSLIITISSFGYFLGNILGSVLFKKIKYQILLPFTYLGLGLALISSILIKNFYIFLIALFLYGFLASVVFNIITIFTHDFSNKKASSMNILHMFYSLGAMSAPLYLTIFQNYKIQYNYLFLLPLIIYTLTFFPLSTIRWTHPKEEPYEKNIKLNNPILIMFLLFAISYIMLEIGIAGWIKNFLEKEFHYNYKISNLYVMVFFISLMLGRFLSSWIVLIFKETLYYILIMQVLGIIIFSLGLFSSLKLLMPISAFFFGGIYPTLVSRYKDFIRNKNQYMGLILSAGSFGSMLAGVVIGRINDKLGVLNGMKLNIIIGIFGIIIILFLIANHKTFSRFIRQNQQNK